MPVIYFLYPETNGRSLEEINLLFTSPSLLVSKNEAEYRRLIEEAGGNVAVAERRLFDSVNTEFDELDAQTQSISHREDLNTAEKGHLELIEVAKVSGTPASSDN
jgi:hypothetical protein